MSARNLTALGFSVGIGVITGVYIFKPTLQEEQKAREFWQHPGEARTGNVADSGDMSQQNPENQPPGRPSHGQDRGE